MERSLYKLRIGDLKFLESRLIIDLPLLKASNLVVEKRKLSYLISYPHFIEYYENKKKLGIHELVIGANFTYGWMPTVFVWKNDNFESVLNLLNKVKNENLVLSIDEFLEIQSLINNSVVGTSKILHFINPSIYPIWDSKINLLLSDDGKKTNTLTRYFEYYAIFEQLKKEKSSTDIAKSISSKIGYDVSFARAFETILFFSDKATLETSKKIATATQKDKPLIPKFKRDEYIFISNLSSITANLNHPITFKRDGYLLSEHFSSPAMVKLAHLVKKKRNLLVSDNGNFSRMKLIAVQFDEAGKALVSLAKEEISNQGEISQATVQKRDSLINEIAVACENSLNNLDLGRVIERQVEIKPDYLIGLEDFTIPVLMMCGMMNSLFHPVAENVKDFQDKTNSLYSNQVEGKFGNKESLDDISKFLVLHAYDYMSAFQGAERLSTINPDGVSISYGAPLRSRQFITSLKFAENVEIFPEKLPEPYLLSTALTMGAVNALKSDMPIHILGVGSPILIALIGQLLHRSRAVSIDSTAPFKDSNVGKLYGSRFAFLKMDMYKLAAHSLINNTVYSSSTPFFKRFENDFPSKWSAMRTELGITSATSVKDVVEQLKSSPSLVEKHIPFFSKMRSGNDAMINQLRMDRAGHNFWILRNICVSVRKRMGDHEKIEQWMQFQVNRYKSIASKKWSKAVEIAFELSKKHKD